MQGVYAQTEKDSLIFNLKFGNQELLLNKAYISKSNDTLQLTEFKFYISDLQIEYNDNSFFKEKQSYHLLNIENSKSLKIAIHKKNGKVISRVGFKIGIDSTASVSGALSGDLDPTNGMYWAWQSGYINMKMEGKSESCITRKNQFQFHIGGYLQPNYAMRSVSIKFNDNTKNQINIVMDLGKLFSEISLKDCNNIMIPGKEAMRIADLSAKIFSIE